MGRQQQHRWVYATVAWVACLAAFHGLPWLSLVGLAALWRATGSGTTRQRLLLVLVWGGLYAGCFHLWLLRTDPLLWGLGLGLRGGVWGLLLLPGLAWQRWRNRGELSAPRQALAWGLGLGLVTAAQLSTPLGFDWEIPLSAFTDQPFALALLPWLGLAGLAVVVGSALALLVCSPLAARAAGGATLVVWLCSSAALHRSSPTGLPENFPAIGLVQTGWPQDQKWLASNVSEATRRLADLTDCARRRGALLVVWPETAWPEPNLHADREAMASIAAFAEKLGAEILVSSLEKRPDGWENVVSLVTPSRGFVATYTKQRLVPIREYVPLLPAEWERRLRSYGGLRGSSRYRHGQGSEIFTVGGFRYAPLICYESTVPDLTQQLADRVDFFVVLSNGATLSSEFAKECHFRSAVLRAAQARRPVFQASNDGVTAVIDARGVVVERLTEGYTGPELLVLPQR